MTEFKAGLTWPKFTAEYKKKHPGEAIETRSVAWEVYKKMHNIVANSFRASSTKITPKKNTSKKTSAKKSKNNITTELYLVTWVQDDQNEELSDKDRMHASTTLFTARPKAVKAILNSLKDIDADYKNMTFEEFNAQIASKGIIYEKEYNTVLLEKMVVNPAKLADPIENGTMI